MQSLSAMEAERSAEQLKLELEALIWAGRAKDAAILSLQHKLEMKQKEAETLTTRNAHLERQLEESRRREAALVDEANAAREAKRKLEVAEEQLCMQLGDLEAEYVELSREHRTQVERLKQQLQDKENVIKSIRCRPLPRVVNVLKPVENLAS